MSNNSKKRYIKKTSQKHKKQAWSTIHPLENEDSQTSQLEDLGPSILRNALDCIGEYSREKAVMMALTSQDIGDLVLKEKVWKQAVLRDFGLTMKAPGVSSFRVYQFLCQFKFLEGKYIVNRQAEIDGREQAVPLEMLQIEFSETGFTMARWRPQGIVGTLTKGDPFMEVELSDVESLLVRQPTITVGQKTASRAAGSNEPTYQWENSRMTLQAFLRSEGSLLQKLENMFQFRQLIPLITAARNELHPMYLMEDGSWPQALPRPGAYITRLNFKCVLGYSAHTMHIQRLNDGRNNYSLLDMNIQVASAHTMSQETQVGLTSEEYLSHNGGLEGNPNRHRDLQDLYISNRNPAQCRAWYSFVPARGGCDGSWKVMVVDENYFMIYNGRTIGRYYRNLDIC